MRACTAAEASMTGAASTGAAAPRPAKMCCASGKVATKAAYASVATTAAGARCTMHATGSREPSAAAVAATARSSGLRCSAGR